VRRTPDDNTRVRRCILATIACFLVAIRADAAEWTSLRTEHFLLIGDASPRAIKDVALRFEQFRAAVASAFPVLADSRPGPPVIVIVFRDQRSYEPYKPKFNGKTVQVGGYFLGSRDVNYITLAADSGGDDFRALYHEYTHLLLQRPGSTRGWRNSSAPSTPAATPPGLDARSKVMSGCCANARCTCRSCSR
jgi:hypothetical protein